MNTPVLKNTPGVEDVPELLGRVDDGGHAVPQDDAVPGVQGHAAIEDVQEQLDVLRVREVASHGLKQGVKILPKSSEEK